MNDYAAHLPAIGPQLPGALAGRPGRALRTDGRQHHAGRDVAFQPLLFMRPVPGSADYRTPVKGLSTSCGAATHPGGGVMGACVSYNAAEGDTEGTVKGGPKEGGGVKSHLIVNYVTV